MDRGSPKDELASPLMHSNTPHFAHAPSMELKEPKLTALGAVKTGIWASIPAIGGLLCETMVEIVNLAFVGRLNNPTLIAGIGLGTLMVNVIVISITTGIGGGVDTLVSQAYGK